MSETASVMIDGATVGLPPRKWSVAAWATVAAASVLISYLITFVLGLAFFLFGLMLAGGMISQGASFFGVMLSAFSLLVGSTMLWSLVPRKDNFEPNGVVIDLTHEVQLAAEIKAIAGLLNEEMPAEVYLTPDVNAGVAQRGGFMGFGSRRVMLLGLPLLQMLSVSQFRSILAHEFAHFYAGDTSLGPWVFKARNTMARVLVNLGNKSPVLSLLTRFAIIALLYMIVIGALVFYWKMFNRLTSYISRQQEFRCDELACHIAGSDAFEQGMRNIHLASAAFGAYWRTVVMPVTETGHCPQLADGFARFMNLPHVAQATTKVLEDRIAAGKAGPMDTHPPLNERIEKARALAIAASRVDERPMVSMISDLQSLELRLLQKLAPDLKTSEMKWTHWDAAGSEIYIPLWRRQTAQVESMLGERTIAMLPMVLGDLGEMANSIADPPGILLTREQRIEKAAETLGSALTLALIDHGWHLFLQPAVFRVTNGDLTLQPRNSIAELRTGNMSNQGWIEYCQKAGIADWPLRTV